MGKKEFSEYLESRIGKNRNAKSNLAKALGVHGSNITKYLKGVNIPTMDKAMRIAQVLGDDPNMVLQLAGYEVPESVKSSAAPLRRLPFAGVVTNGKISFLGSYKNNIFSKDIAAEYMETDRLDASHNDYCLRLEGDSLFPAFPAGSVLLVSPGKTFAPNMLCAVRSTDGPSWLRFVTVFNTVYTLASVNPGYAPFSLNKEDIEFIHPVKWVAFP
jgi:phage repressor protein C with HTH and peptisase S24 domain